MHCRSSSVKTTTAIKFAFGKLLIVALSVVAVEAVASVVAIDTVGSSSAIEATRGTITKIEDKTKATAPRNRLDSDQWAPLCEIKTP